MFNAAVASLLIVFGSLYAAVADTDPSVNILPSDTDYFSETPDQQFKRADANADGKLDKCEFANKDGWTAQNNALQFKDFDTNVDGFVSKAEQDAYLKKQEEEAQRWLAEYYNNTFKEFDTNHDNLIQMGELTSLLKTQYSSSPGPTFPFAKYDTNGDKGLNLDEYKKFEADIPWDTLVPIESVYLPDDDA